MKVYKIGNTTVLEPEDGFKYITNDEVWSTMVFLGKNDNVDNWHDTNEEPPEPPQPEPEDENTDNEE